MSEDSDVVERLSDCPFCGGPAVAKSEYWSRNNDAKASVRCRKGCNGACVWGSVNVDDCLDGPLDPEASAQAEAFRRARDKWNSRPIEDALRSELAKVKGERDEAARLLRERDGGRHDSDCKFLRVADTCPSMDNFRSYPCTCQHNEVTAFLSRIEIGERDDG